MTCYVQALDHRGNWIGLYVEAPDYDAAYDLAVERDDIDIVRSVQRIAGGDQFALSLVWKKRKGLSGKDEGGRKTGRQLNADTHAHRLKPKPQLTSALFKTLF